MNILFDIHNLTNTQNCVAIDFNTNEKFKCKLSLENDAIKSCGEILAQHLIDYIKKGGDINNLTPNELFNK